MMMTMSERSGDLGRGHEHPDMSVGVVFVVVQFIDEMLGQIDLGYRKQKLHIAILLQLKSRTTAKQRS